MIWVTRFSTSSFFHDLNPSGPLINRLKYFRIRFWFRRDIWIFKSWAVCIPPRCQTTRCAHRWVKLRSVHPTAESGSRCASHHGVKWWKILQKLCGVQHTAELDPWCDAYRRVNNLSSTVYVLIPNFTNAISLWCLKILISNWYCKSQIVQEIFFTSDVFRENGVERCSKYKNTKNWHFWISLTLQCASHRGVELHGVH